MAPRPSMSLCFVLTMLASLLFKYSKSAPTSQAASSGPLHFLFPWALSSPDILMIPSLSSFRSLFKRVGLFGDYATPIPIPLTLSPWALLYFSSYYFSQQLIGVLSVSSNYNVGLCFPLDIWCLQLYIVGTQKILTESMNKGMSE